jgi:hypothetical protein
MKRLLLTLLLLAGCKNVDKPQVPVTVPDTVKSTVVHQPEISNSLELQIRKLGPLASKVIDNDYTDGVRLPGQVAVTVSPHSVKKMGACALYDPQTNIFIFPRNESNSIHADSFPHEFSHYVYASIGLERTVRGIPFVGPSISDIKSYMTKRLASPDLAGLRKEQKEMLTLNGKMRLVKKFNRSIRRFNDYSDLVKGMIETTNMLHSRGIVVDKATIDTINSYSARQDEYFKIIKPLAKERDFEVLGDAFKGLESLASEQKSGNVFIGKMIDEYKGKVHEYYEGLRADARKDFPDHFDDLVKTYDNAEIIAVESMEIYTLGLGSMGIDSLGSMVDNMTSSAQRKSIEEVLIPNEILARMVNSLCNLHFGDSNLSNFELNDKDLALLSKFSWNGTAIYAQQVDKYSLTRRMINDGVSNVRDQLMDATEFTYKGKKHSWPLAEFNFVGDKLPVQD